MGSLPRDKAGVVHLTATGQDALLIQGGVGWRDGGGPQHPCSHACTHTRMRPYSHTGTQTYQQIHTHKHRCNLKHVPMTYSHIYSHTCIWIIRVIHEQNDAHNQAYKQWNKHRKISHSDTNMHTHRHGRTYKQTRSKTNTRTSTDSYKHIYVHTDTLVINFLTRIHTQQSNQFNTNQKQPAN